MTEQGNFRRINLAARDVLMDAYGGIVAVTQLDTIQEEVLTPKGRAKLLDSISRLVDAIREDATLHGDHAALDRIGLIGMDEELMKTIEKRED